MLAWPEWMPKPLQDGFSMQPEDRRIASSTVGTSFSSGFGGDVCIAECSVVLNPLQAHWLEQVERDELVHGARWFSFPLWYGGEVHWEPCRFKTRPKAGGVSGRYAKYQFTLYVRHRSELIPECLFKLFACWPPCFFFGLNGALGSMKAHLSKITNASIASAMEN